MLTNKLNNKLIQFLPSIIRHSNLCIQMLQQIRWHMPKVI